ncbi:hypothetical protein ABZT03_25675 [Streptomyces sp. NPDC005574]|uniref:hypothetical protein n=1 Tax=Streptomyces sp. NPDC005574 TaxID=3156891 RepID=UPI0033B052E9
MTAGPGEALGWGAQPSASPLRILDLKTEATAVLTIVLVMCRPARRSAAATSDSLPAGRMNVFHGSVTFVSGPAPGVPQPTAFFTRALMTCSSAAVNSFRA